MIGRMREVAPARLPNRWTILADDCQQRCHGQRGITSQGARDVERGSEPDGLPWQLGEGVELLVQLVEAGYTQHARLDQLAKTEEQLARSIVEHGASDR